MYSSRKYTPTASPPPFKAVIKGRRMHDQYSETAIPTKVLNRMSNLQSMKSRRFLSLQHKRGESIDFRLAMFFHRKGRPRPQPLVSRLLTQPRKFQLRLPHINKSYSTLGNSKEETYQLVSDKNYTIDLPKTLPTQMAQNRQVSNKPPRKKNQRGRKLRQRKKTVEQYNLITKQGWNNQTRRNWIGHL